MNKPFLLATAVACLLLPSVPLFAAAPLPDEASLLAAWEARQKADPRVETLERTGEGSYRYKTSLLPYEGELRVVEAVVEELPGRVGGGTAMGRVEVELPDLPPDFYQRHPASYGVWSRGNTLAWDAAKARWTGMEEYQQAVTAEYRCGWGWGSILGAIWPYLLLLLLLFLFLRLSARRYRGAMDRSLAGQDKALANQELSMGKLEESLDLARRTLAGQEEMIALLREIRDQLKRQ